MIPIEIKDARARLCELVELAASGQDVVLGRNGKPLVRITRLKVRKRRIKFGVLKGRLFIPDDFDAPFSADVVAGFER